MGVGAIVDTDVHRTARRSDRRDLDQRPEHGHRLLGQEEETSETFHNILKSRTNPSHAEARPTRLWVRTGDYGAYHDGELYITGRVKDLVIIDGRNHYPQDLEYSAQEATKALRTGFVAAFSVPANQPARRGVRQRALGPQARPGDTSNSW